MGEARRERYGIVIVGLVYAAIGITFAWPTSQVRMWRAAAWILSAAIYATHIGYERFRMHSPAQRAALHVAGAVALGAFGMAVSALVHSLSVNATRQHSGLLVIALVAWPILTGVPAFIVAFGAGEGLVRFRSKRAVSPEFRR